MALARPLVTVFETTEATTKKSGSVVLPTVFHAPLRPDLVRYIHTNMAKNRRQAYAVSTYAGYHTSAESWGTGRAVARIPRVAGGGTHRAGQGAFGNMCRGGGMFNPTKIWRRWHRKINITQKRHALISAIAASAATGLVMARGHRVDEVAELPIVVSDDVQKLEKTKAAVSFLKSVGLKDEMQKVLNSIKLRAGHGKARGRRWTKRRGPLIVYTEDNGLTRAFKNIPGVDLCHVDRLNLLQLAPGGTLGRLVIWTEAAFKRLELLYGNYRGGSQLKKGYMMLRPEMTNADLGRIINSEEIQSVIRPKLAKQRRGGVKKNLLTNYSVRCRVNPAYSRLRRRMLSGSKKTTAAALK